MAQPTNKPGQMYIQADPDGSVRVFAVGEDGVPQEVHMQRRDVNGQTFHVIAPRGHAANILRALPYKR